MRRTLLKPKIWVTLIILMVFVVYIANNINDFKPLLDVNPLYLCIIASIVIISIVSNGIFTKFVMESFKKPIDTRESTYVSLIASVGNFFAPAGSGFGIRAVYLKKKHGLAYSDYMTLLSGNYVIVFLVVSLLGMVSLGFIHVGYSVAERLLWLMFVGLFVLSVALLIIRVPRKLQNLKPKNQYVASLYEIIVRVSVGWSEITRNRVLMIKLVCLVLFNTLMGMASTFLIIKSLHLHVGLPSLALFSALSSLAMFINITPGNLGIKEALYVFSSGALGLTTDQIISVALIDRIVLFVVLLVLWLFFVKDKVNLAATK